MFVLMETEATETLEGALVKTTVLGLGDSDGRPRNLKQRGEDRRRKG